jgi:hypothetical protein
MRRAGYFFLYERVQHGNGEGLYRSIVPALVRVFLHHSNAAPVGYLGFYNRAII